MKRWLVAILFACVLGYGALVVGFYLFSPGAQERRSDASQFFGCDESRETDCG